MITEELRNERMKSGVFWGFIPNKLIIENRKELLFFPFNIMFMQMKEQDGKRINGTSLYDPDISSFKVSDRTISMKYHNKYGGNNYIVISIYEENNIFQYTGEKFINEQIFGTTSGKISSFEDEYGWKMFFTHLTIMGLADGERCKFEDVKN